MSKKKSWKVIGFIDWDQSDGVDGQKNPPIGTCSDPQLSELIGIKPVTTNSDILKVDLKELGKKLWGDSPPMPTLADSPLPGPPPGSRKEILAGIRRGLKRRSHRQSERKYDKAAIKAVEKMRGAPQ